MIINIKWAGKEYPVEKFRRKPYYSTEYPMYRGWIPQTDIYYQGTDVEPVHWEAEISLDIERILDDDDKELGAIQGRGKDLQEAVDNLYKRIVRIQDFLVETTNSNV